MCTVGGELYVLDELEVMATDYTHSEDQGQWPVRYRADAIFLKAGKKDGYVSFTAYGATADSAMMGLDTDIRAAEMAVDDRGSK